MISTRQSLSVLALVVALSAIASTATIPAFAQCPQPAKRSFGPYSPAAGSSTTLANPLLPAGQPANPVLKIVTLGDSVVWGDGNKEDNKFVVKVAHDLANATGRSAVVEAYAHSGARLFSVADKTSLVPADGDTYQMDLNSQSPSTAEQATCAAAQEADAELVILDGCINEVGATKIALPIPLNWTTPKHIHQWAYTACSKPMRTVLDQVKQSFPKATIVVVNYYQVVTGLSRLELKQQLPGAPPAQPSPRGTSEAAARELQNEQDRLLALYGQNKVTLFDAPIPQSNSDVLYAWQRNSIEFLNTSEDCFDWAVAAADGSNVDSLDGLASCPTAPSDKAPSAAPATPTVRVFLAKIPEDDAFGYGAPETHEWRLPTTAHPDDMYAVRVPLCESHYQGKLGDKETCKINAMAHPNVLGAEAYHKSIFSIMQTAWALNSAH